MNETEHTLTIVGRKKACISGVAEVQSVTQERLKLVLANGCGLVIVGEKLKMGAFSKQTGQFNLDGVITEVKYAGEKGSLIKKLLK